jgi:hypothetical protein
MRILGILASIAILLWELLCLFLTPSPGDGGIGVAALLYYSMFLELGVSSLLVGLGLLGPVFTSDKATHRSDWTILRWLACIAFAVALVRCIRWFW